MVIRRKAGFLCILLAVIIVTVLNACGKEKTEGAYDGYKVEELPLNEIPDRVENVQSFSGVIWLIGKRDGKFFLGNFTVQEQNYQEMDLGLPENEQMVDFYIDAEENTVIVTSKEKSEKNRHFETLKLYEYSGNGEIKLISELGDCYNTYQLCITEENIYLLEEGEGISVFDRTGGKSCTLKSTQRIRKLCRYQGECYYAASEAGTVKIGKINSENGKTSEEFLTNIPIGDNIWIFPPADGTDGIYYMDSRSVYRINTGKKSAEKILIWDVLSLLESSLSFPVSLEDEGFLCWCSEEQSFLWITKEEQKEKQTGEKEQEMEELVFASAGFNDSDREMVYRFNEEHENCKIIMKDYSEYEDSSTQLNLDISSGNIPDIMDLNFADPTIFAKKGMFTDLSEFMSEDEEVSEKDLEDKVIELCKTDGHVYFLPRGFCMEALIGNSEELGERERWTLEEFEDFCRGKNAEGIDEIVANMNGASFAGWDCRFTMENYIHPDTGEVDFQTEDFNRLLFISKNYFTMEPDLKKSSLEKVKEGEAPLMTLFLYNFIRCMEYQWAFGTEGYSFIGYPSQKGSGVGLRIEQFCAIAENCSMKKEAWEFLRQYFLKEKQMEFSYGFSVRKDVMEYQKECAIAKKAYTNEKGEEITPLTGYVGVSDVSLEMRPLRKKQIKQIEELIEKADIISFSASLYFAASNMIMDEAYTCFSDDKSVEEVADIVQSRLSLRVNEQMD